MFVYLRVFVNSLACLFMCVIALLSVCVCKCVCVFGLVVCCIACALDYLLALCLVCAFACLCMWLFVLVFVCVNDCLFIWLHCCVYVCVCAFVTVFIFVYWCESPSDYVIVCMCVWLLLMRVLVSLSVYNYLCV